MTKQTFHYFKSDFSEYIRNNCLDSKLGLVVCDIDYIVRDYNRKLVMILEEKTNNNHVPFAESQTLQLVSNGLRHNTLGYKHLGVYIIQVGNSVQSDPIHLAMITNRNLLDFKQVSIETLIGFLGFDISFEEIDCLQTTQ